jgi:hypothetical protein
MEAMKCYSKHLAVVFGLLGLVCLSRFFVQEDGTPSIQSMPPAYWTDPALFPSDFLEGLRLPGQKRFAQDRDLVRQICKVIIEADQINQRKFGQDYNIDVDCDISKFVIQMEPETVVFDDCRVFVGDLASSAERILDDLERGK